MPFMTNGKRDYKKEAKWERTEKPSRRADRNQRKRARYEMEKEGKVKRNDGKQVDHLKAILYGGSNNKSNLKVVSAKKNLTKEANRKKRAAKK